MTAVTEHEVASVAARYMGYDLIKISHGYVLKGDWKRSRDCEREHAGAHRRFSQVLMRWGTQLHLNTCHCGDISHNRKRNTMSNQDQGGQRQGGQGGQQNQQPGQGGQQQGGGQKPGQQQQEPGRQGGQQGGGQQGGQGGQNQNR